MQHYHDYINYYCIFLGHIRKEANQLVRDHNEYLHCFCKSSKEKCYSILLHCGNFLGFWCLNVIEAYYMIGLSGPILNEQLKSVNEMIKNKVHFMGNAIALTKMQQQEKVLFYFFILPFIYFQCKFW